MLVGFFEFFHLDSSWEVVVIFLNFNQKINWKVCKTETSILNARAPLCFVVVANFYYYKKRESYLLSFCEKFVL